MKLTDEEKKEIVTNIREAKDKRKQVQIEADLHCVSKRDVKDIMKEYGISLRILNGENFCKSEKQEEQAVEHDWEDMAIPPLEPPVKGKVKYKKPEIIDVQDIPKQTEQAEESRKLIENAADSPKMLRDVPAEDVLFIGPHILEDDKIIDALGKKIHDLAERRRGLVAEVELIDIRLRKYSYFCQDLAEVIESEGVEV
jgi:hypothetical protein